MKRTVTLIGLAVAASSMGCSKWELTPPDAPTPCPPQISASINASNDTIFAGDSVMITVTAGDSVASGLVLPVGLSTTRHYDTLVVRPAQSTTYVFRVVGAGDHRDCAAQASVFVEVLPQPAPAPPSASIVAVPTTIDVGQSATLFLVATHADSGLLVPDGVWLRMSPGDTLFIDTIAVTPRATTTYEWTAVRADGASAHDAATVTVNTPTQVQKDSFEVPLNDDIVDGNDDCCPSPTEIVSRVFTVPSHVDSLVEVSVDIELTGSSQRDESFALGLRRANDTGGPRWIFGSDSTCPVVRDPGVSGSVSVRVGFIEFDAAPGEKLEIVARHAIRFACHSPYLDGTPNSVRFNSATLVYWREK